MPSRIFRAGLFLTLLFGAATADAQQGRKKPRKPAPAPAAPVQRRTSGEDTTLRTTTLEILQEYRPQVRRAPRPQFQPSPPRPDTARTPQTYEVPQQALFYTYRSLPLRPLALGADTAQLPPGNFIRLGGGNQSTAFAEIGLGNLTGQQFRTTVTGKHLSQTGNIAHQQTSLSDLQIGAAWLGPGAHQINAALSGLHNRYRYYGGESQPFADLDSMKQSFTGIRFSADAAPTTSPDGRWNYHPEVWGSYYGDAWNASERGAGLYAPVTHRLDSVVTVSLGLLASTYSFRQNDRVESNNLLQLRPAADIIKGQFRAHIGLTPSLGTSESALLPDLHLTYSPSPAIAFSAGWKGEVNQNTYQALTTRNPFINSQYYKAVQSRATEAYVQAATAFADHFKVRVRAALWDIDRMPVFLGEGFMGGKKFSVYHADFKAFAVSGDVRYAIGETFSVGGSGEWYHYYDGNTERPWHEPAVRLRGDIQVQPLPGLRVSGYIHALDGIYYTNDFGEASKLPLYVDLGAGADYVIIRQVAVFMRATNILSRRNERWQGYAAYKANIYGGVSIRFK